MKERRNLIFLLAWLTAYAGLLFFFKHEYLFLRFSFVLGLALSPFIVRQISQQKSLWYGWIALAFGSVLLLERSNMAYYFCAGFGLLFLLESARGRLNRLPVFLLVVMSPVFQYIAEVWSFPVRLKMSELAARALSISGLETKAAGNVILLDGAEFSVDPACMGLNMLSTSLLLALLLLAWFERQRDFIFSIKETAGWMLLTLLLALLANFNRLLVLVLFHILPEDPMHDAWGVLGMVVYVLLPLYFLIRWRSRLVSGVSAEEVLSPLISSLAKRSMQIIRVAILTLLLFAGQAPEHEPAFNEGNVQAYQIPGYRHSLTEDGVLKLENDSTLIYIKPPSGFMRASHDPRICWKGSGYEFKRVQRQTLAGLEVYTAVLEKGNDQLYTAWWYDNGLRQTVEEWDWRWAGLLGGKQGYRLVNVTCSSSEGLEGRVKMVKSCLPKPL